VTKFNVTDHRAARGTSPITATGPALTHEGGVGYARDLKSELLLLAVSNMVGEDSYYEKAGDRDARYVDLVRRAAVADPVWTAGLLGWLRTEGNMRSASLVGAAEFVKARLDADRAEATAGYPRQHPRQRAAEDSGLNRKVIASVLQRADEPGEMLAYWMSHHGRNIPKPVKRGVADAFVRLANEYNLLKYDTASHGLRFGDVLELTHPSPGPLWQGDLFRHALDRRHGRNEEIPEGLRAVRARDELIALPPTDRHAFMRAVRAGDVVAGEKFRLAMAGQWEWVKSWLGE
jgi:hypothetical protein